MEADEAVDRRRKVRGSTPGRFSFRLPARNASWAFALTLICMAGPAAAKPASGPAPPPEAPGFTLPTDRGTVCADSLRGSVVLVDFWASWCGPCAASFPWLKSIQEKYGNDGLRVVAIDLDKDREAAYRFLRLHPAPFTVAFDPKGDVAEKYKVPSMPTSFLIGPDGTLLYEHRGFDPGKTADFEAAIGKACAR